MGYIGPRNRVHCESALLQVVGDVAQRSCNNCLSERGPRQQCVILTNNYNNNVISACAIDGKGIVILNSTLPLSLRRQRLKALLWTNQTQQPLLLTT